MPSGLLWATCNVGANAPEEYGDYFAWGETSPKDEYTEDNCSTYEKQINDISGNAQYDAARANWGGKWRLPTKSEMQELEDKCTWEWMTQNGVNGYKVTGPSGASIFLPATGDRSRSSLYDTGIGGYYWSSTPHESDANGAYKLSFHSGWRGYLYMYSSSRNYGYCVRPVLEDSSAEVKVKAELEKTRKALAEALDAAQPKEKTIKDGHEYVDLGLPSGLKWATCNIGARAPEASGDYFAWGEIKTKKSFSESGSLTYGKKKYSIEIAGNSQLDAARANWGGSWRMPTKYECQELIDKCKWEWVAVNRVNGYKVTGPNGNKIFLPATGYRLWSLRYLAGSNGYYWSSAPNGGDGNNAYYLYFDCDDHCMRSNLRYVGRSVRPVLE